jgi:MFS family permease
MAGPEVMIAKNRRQSVGGDRQHGRVTLAPYRSVLAIPGVARLLVFSILARMPHAAASVVMTLHVAVGLDRGYGAAGLVVAVLTAGMAIGGPWLGRLVDRVGVRKALILPTLAEAALWGSAPFVPYQGLLVLAFFGGLLGLPIFSVVRQSLSVSVPRQDQRAAYALDSMSVELTYMFGPILGVLVATQVSTDAGLLTLGASQVVAGLLFIALNPPTRGGEQADDASPDAAAEGSGRWRPAWLGVRMIAVFVATAGALIVLGGTEVSVVAFLRDAAAEELTGLVFALWSVASLLGGLVFGAVRRSVSPFVLLLGLAVLCIPVGLAPGPVWLALAIIPTGAVCAPVLSATAAAVAAEVPERMRGEAMGWYGTAMTLGLAVGSPFAGAVIDLTRPWAGFAAVGLAGLLIAVLGLVIERRSTGGGLEVTPAAVPPAAGPGADRREADVPV